MERQEPKARPGPLDPATVAPRDDVGVTEVLMSGLPQDTIDRLMLGGERRSIRQLLESTTRK